MKERPILFSASMIRAILDGRKTQTRRLVKDVGAVDRGTVVSARTGAPVVCPYGISGERLWVRETWSPVERPADAVDGIRFKADDAFVPIDSTAAAADRWVQAANNDHSGRWRPSIYMPRWASRISLEVTDVRVEHLQDISERDACAEGIGSPLTRDCKVPKLQALWEEINGKRAPWRTNPFVWVVSFRRLSP